MSQGLTGVLAQGSVARRNQRRFRQGLGVIGLLAISGWLLLRSGTEANSLHYRTEGVTRGRLVVTVSATGILQPTNQVDVGSELSGFIEAVLVDDNDPVHKGDVLVRLDTSRLQDQVERSRASLASAEAQVRQMQATVVEATANLNRFREMFRLSKGKLPAQADLDTAEATLKRAQAAEASARASVGQARASLQSDQTNLAKAHIRSPIDGVVLSRKAEPGQTVAATLQSPVLFTLAENLARMELQVDVDEADVGQVAAGQSATFTVDAYPGRHYPAQLRRVSFGSQTKDGVVTYPTVLVVNNDDLTLRPGMTASAEIVTALRDNTLRVPNAALRFTPPRADKGTGSFISRLMPRPPTSERRANQGREGAEVNNTGPKVWVLREGQPLAVSVVTGLSDGRYTEILQGDLPVATEVILEVEAQAGGRP